MNVLIQSIWIVAVLGGAAVLAFLAHGAIFGVLRRLADKLPGVAYSSMLKWFRAPSRWAAILLAMVLAMPLSHMPPEWLAVARHLLSLLVILSVAWLLIRAGHVADDIFSQAPDEPQARKVRTQLHLLERIFTALVTVLTIGAMLMTFDQVRQLGTSILASAGIVGLVVGLAAQKTLAALLAGVQIALAQPIRLGDAVVVDGEFGYVEEITLSYVVLRTPDRRRLVLPITFFLDRSFQNWSREATTPLGAVTLQVNLSLPVEAVRQELLRALEASPLWDHKTWRLQVTNLTPTGAELTAYVSGADPAATWNLRCEVREKLLEFLRTSTQQAKT
jgi:small-conductance mechanosensitive channel